MNPNFNPFQYLVDEIRKKFGSFITSESTDDNRMEFKCNFRNDYCEISKISLTKGDNAFSVSMMGKYPKDTFATSYVDFIIKTNYITILSTMICGYDTIHSSRGTDKYLTLEAILKNTPLVLFPVN